MCLVELTLGAPCSQPSWVLGQTFKVSVLVLLKLWGPSVREGWHSTILVSVTKKPSSLLPNNRAPNCKLSLPTFASPFPEKL